MSGEIKAQAPQGIGTYDEPGGYWHTFMSGLDEWNRSAFAQPGYGPLRRPAEPRRSGRTLGWRSAVLFGGLMRTALRPDPLDSRMWTHPSVTAASSRA